jgi:uncharacterized repeat protein (TIGR04076 family)
VGPPFCAPSAAYHLKEGQEFITDVVVGIPQDFCPWAWDDMYKTLVAFFADDNFGMWNEGGDTIIACCTGGTRPVCFKLEKLPADASS